MPRTCCTSSVTDGFRRRVRIEMNAYRIKCGPPLVRDHSSKGEPSLFQEHLTLHMCPHRVDESRTSDRFLCSSRRTRKTLARLLISFPFDSSRSIYGPPEWRGRFIRSHARMYTSSNSDATRHAFTASTRNFRVANLLPQSWKPWREFHFHPPL